MCCSVALKSEIRKLNIVHLLIWALMAAQVNICNSACWSKDLIQRGMYCEIKFTADEDTCSQMKFIVVWCEKCIIESHLHRGK